MSKDTLMRSSRYKNLVPPPPVILRGTRSYRSGYKSFKQQPFFSQGSGLSLLQPKFWRGTVIAITAAVAITGLLILNAGTDVSAALEKIDTPPPLAQVAPLYLPQEEEEEEEEEDSQESDKPTSFAHLESLSKKFDFLAQAALINDEHGDKQERWTIPGGRILTVNPLLQKKTTRLLKNFAVPYGAVVAIEPSTGRILAMAEHSEENPSLRGLPLKAIYPAASVFKIVTGTALLKAGVSSQKTVCYHGGRSRLTEKLLQDSRRDGRCSTLAEAMGFSTNVIFAKLAKQKLGSDSLTNWAARYGFNIPFPFIQPVDVSQAHIPQNEFEFAKTAAGFGEVFLSPLHAASIVATIGNRGVMRSPVLFEGEKGSTRRVIDESTAAILADMMEITVTKGTARKSFRERGRYALGDVSAVGKTGSIFDRDPFRDYSWFVGWAPKENPRIAVAVVIVNGHKWRVRAPFIAREALRAFFADASKTKSFTTASR